MARKQREAWGRARKLPSGRWQASYQGPDMAVHKASATFPTLTAARGWLTAERQLIDTGTWAPPVVRRQTADPGTTLAAYWSRWISTRTVKGQPLKPSTQDLYSKHWDNHISSPLGAMPLRSITAATVRGWHANLDTGPTAKAHAYALLRTVLQSAVDDDLIPTNPCRIKGAGTSPARARTVTPATPEEIERVRRALPKRYRALVLIGAWCGLRWGEITELRRGDVDIDRGVIRVSRAVTHVRGTDVVGTPKTRAGVRDVHIPPHIIRQLRKHLETWSDDGPDGIVITGPTGDRLHPSTFRPIWDRARKEIGRPDLRIHDLRHTHATMVGQVATIAESQRRIGHTTAAMALRYQHATQQRDKEIARQLSRAEKRRGAKASQTKSQRA